MIIQNQVGTNAIVNSLPPGSTIVGRAGGLGEGIGSVQSPNYYESVYRKASFFTCNSVPTQVTGGLTSSYSGLAISNPPGSTINAVLQNIGYSFPSASFTGSAAVIGLMVGYNATAPITNSVASTIRNSFVNGPVGQVIGSTSCTFPNTPVLTKVFGKIDTGSITVSTQAPMGFAELKGTLILPPGAYAAIYSSISSSNAVLLGSFDWQEIPI
jgi:hypothetical protein